MDQKVKLATWVMPATKELWRKGYFGMCTNCQHVNKHTEIAPNYCERCGAFMINSRMK